LGSNGLDKTKGRKDGSNYMETINEFTANGNYKGAYAISKKLDVDGVIEGTLILSGLYHNGDYVKQSYKKEVELLKKAIKMGSSVAKYKLAAAYILGKGTKKKESKALRMMNELADVGFESALKFLYEEECDCEACISERGCGAGVLVKCGESLDVVMERFVGFIKEGDFDTAFTLATELDGMDIVNGTFALSVLYHNGQGTEQDFAREVSLLEKAVKKEFEPAIFHLAIALTLGKGIEQDTELAFEMIRDLADAGYPDALEMMAA